MILIFQLFALACFSIASDDIPTQSPKSDSPSQSPTTTLIKLNYNSEQDFENQIQTVFNQLDSNSDGKLNHTEFTHFFNPTGSLFSTPNIIPSNETDVNIFSKFKDQIWPSWQNIISDWLKQKYSQSIADQFWNLLMGKGSDNNSIDSQHFSQIFTQLLSFPIPANATENCPRVQHLLASCTDPKSVFELHRMGDFIQSIGAQCQQGIGFLSDFQIEYCVLQSTDCAKRIDCYSNFNLLKLEERVSKISQKFTNAAYQMNLTATPPQNTSVFDSLLFKRDVIPDLNDNLNITELNSTLLSENDRLTLVTQRKREDLATKEGVVASILLALGIGVFGPNAMGYFCIAAILILLPISPFIYSQFLVANARIDSEENFYRQNKSIILSTKPECASKSKFYWGSCGAVGSGDARSCPNGGTLWNEKSCTSKFHFYEGSLLCGYGDQLSGTKDRSASADYWYDYFLFRCQSLCYQAPDYCQ